MMGRSGFETRHHPVAEIVGEGTFIDADIVGETPPRAHLHGMHR